LGAINSKTLFFKRTKLVHIEAGLRSKKLFEPFPEEIVRRIVDAISNFLFLPSNIDYENVKKYTNKKIVISGNTIVDSIDYTLKSGYKLKEKKSNYILVSIHRYENLNIKERLIQVIKFITYIFDKYKETIIWPMHDNTFAKLKEFELDKELTKRKDIILTKPKDYFEFIHMSKNCKYLIADGGSIQEESVFLKKPVFLLRKYTERVAGLGNKYNLLTKLDFGIFKKQLNNYYTNNLKGNEILVYGKPPVSKKIINILEK
jgi:UDP-N-acetylglucosamine 2-epimerase (non-hydrolysing)